MSKAKGWQAVSKTISSLVPPIHQPLPLSKRDSQRLLDALKTSFRSELDRQHGPSPNPLSGPKASTTLTSASASSAEKPDVPHRPTDVHLHSILNNPLLSQASSPRRTSGIGSPYDHDKEVFQQAVAKGLMTIPRAHGFLLKIFKTAEKNTLSQSPLYVPLQGTGAGLLVLQWLKASGQHNTYSWLSNQKFSVLLLRFMIAEGLDDMVWIWLERVMKQASSVNTMHSRICSDLLIKHFIAAHTCTEGLRDAYSSVIQVESMLKKNELPLNQLGDAWSLVAWNSTVASWKHAKAPVSLFEPFVAMSIELERRLHERAHLDLYHPTDPSAELALQYFREDDSFVKRLLSQWDPAAAPKMPPYVQRVMALGIDAANHLMSADRVREANTILDCISGIQNRIQEIVGGGSGELKPAV
ncbi:hypothetical protein QC762_609120 [Podospora pseudocomata]|uniref:NWD NACHT-NTPase N-terminal domain-containing protein n=1 Tax=Podospora pseudocomata TaxID=2093779 RepID=A0ABR0G8W7_9PEZI|nr:hypothetical protein QC762_609120 [Podospora pseudocomata]